MANDRLFWIVRERNGARSIFLQAALDTAGRVPAKMIGRTLSQTEAPGEDRVEVTERRSPCGMIGRFWRSPPPSE